MKKNELLFALILSSLFLNISCSKKKGSSPSPELDNLIYKSDCTISELYWLPDNETLLMNDFCNGTLKKINTSTKAVQLFDLVAKGHLPQKFFYSEQLPNLVFYPSLTKNQSGGYGLPLKFYSLDLVSGNSVLILDYPAQNITGDGFMMGNKKLALQVGNQLLVINLEQSSSQTFSITGNAQGFSPDDSKILVYSSTTPITASTFDLATQSMQSIALSAIATPLWRTSGIFGYIKTNNLQYLNLQTGANLKSFNDLLWGPWTSRNSTTSVLFAKGANYSNDSKGSLIKYDLTTGQSKEITTATYTLGFISISGISLAAASNNQSKIAYVQNYKELRTLTMP